tara:strand:+ start:198 stop:605 length:408 start_codon:yes stop_codon:yes gene_type:complete
MQTLSDYQKKVLLKSKVIEKFTEQHVIFTSSFKIKAVEAYLAGKDPNDIFTNAGIDVSFFTKRYPTGAIRKWKDTYIRYGKESLKAGRKKTKPVNTMTKANLDKLSYDELRAVVDIQKEVIESLKKKRALAKKKY